MNKNDFTNSNDEMDEALDLRLNPDLSDEAVYRATGMVMESLIDLTNKAPSEKDVFEHCEALRDRVVEQVPGFTDTDVKKLVTQCTLMIVLGNFAQEREQFLCNPNYH